ncbi:MAG: alpha/beta hydrolase [Phycisphaerales bacterium]
MARVVESIVGLLPLLAIGLVIAIWTSTWLVVRRLRHPPRRTAAWALAKGRPSDPSELDRPLAFEAWSLRVERGVFAGLELPVWDIAGLDADGPTLVLTPGWGDSRLGMLQRAERLAPRCRRLLLWDPPGEGEAPGVCRLGWNEHEALGELLDRASTADERVVLFGASLGAGVSVVLAAQRAGDARIVGVVAESPYRLPKTPAVNVLRMAGMPHRVQAPLGYWWLGLRVGAGFTWRGFDRAAHASRIGVPLLVLHGSQDAISPLEDGEAIAKAAPNGRLEIVEGAGHNDLWSDPDFAQASERAVGGFLRGLARETQRRRDEETKC